MYQTTTTTKSSSSSDKNTTKFTAGERAAIKERVRELQASETNGENDVLAKIAEMTEPDRSMASRLHALIKASAPTLTPKTWYGMPAYAKDGKVVCFFKCAQKFNARYATFEFSDQAKFDDGAMWPVAYALKELTSIEETRIAELLKKAVSEA